MSLRVKNLGKAQLADSYAPLTDNRENLVILSWEIGWMETPRWLHSQLGFWAQLE